MGAKNSNGIVIDKASMVKAIVTYRTNAPKLMERSENIRTHVKALRENEDLMQGDRAEVYLEGLGNIQKVAEALAAYASEAGRVAEAQYQYLVSSVDSGRKDTAANEAADKARKVKNSKLKGQ